MAASCDEAENQLVGMMPGKGEGEDGAAASAVAAPDKRTSTTPLEKYEKEALAAIRSYLMDHREQILNVKGKVLSGQWAPKKTKDAEAREKPNFDNSYMSFRQIPKYFYGDFLCSLCDFSVEQVDLINSKDRQAIRCMICYFFGVHDSDYLPRPCLNKATLSSFLVLRGELLGRRWVGWAKKCVNGDGVINWSLGAAYTLTWAEGKVVSVKHNSSGKTAPVNSVNVTEEGWEVQEIYSDKRALLKEVGEDLAPSISNMFKSEVRNQWLDLFTKQKMQKHAVQVEKDVAAKTKIFVKGDLSVLQTAAKEDQEKRMEARKRRCPNKRMSMALTDKTS